MARKKQRARGAAHAVPVHNGPFGREQAERLLWRAGFGPRPGEAEALAAKGLTGAVRALTRPASQALVGPAPTDGEGRPIAPRDAWGHDQLWWLDRMARTQAPLVERMTLVWHDWFATSIDGVGQPRLMLEQNATLRTHAFGSFRTLTRAVTRDPAMLLWLSGSSNNRWAPNENYARELMELFTLGARGGYTERDVREQARALTGFRNDWADGRGPHRFRYDPKFHDTTEKRVFGRRGRYGWKDAVDLSVRHRAHPGFFVRKLWSYFVPTRIPTGTERALAARYVASGHEIRPVLEAILLHPALHAGPRMVKPPVVHTVGMLRALGRGIDTGAWAWLSGLGGQTLFRPPNVAGWDEGRWLDTATYRGRWMAAGYASERARVADPKAYLPSVGGSETPQQAVDRALAFWGAPTITAATRERLLAFAVACDAVADEKWKAQQYPGLRQNALRMLIATSPDLQTS